MPPEPSQDEAAETRQYDVHGLAMAVRADSVELVEAARRLIGAFEVVAEPSRGEGANGFDVRMRLGAPAEFRCREALARRSFWSGAIVGGLEIDFRTAGERRLMDIRGRCRMWADLAARRAEIVAAPGSEWAVTEGCLIPLLTESLGAAGQHIVHAACLSRGDGDGAPAVLVAGPSGAGKTTTALALRRGGMRFLTDDGTFVIDRGGDSPLTAWGLPTPCKVLAGTLKLLGGLDELPRRPGRYDGEYAVQAADTATSARRTVTASLILLLQPPNTVGHRLTPVDKLTAVATLARENVRAYEPASTSPGGKAFRAIARLVAQCKVFSLSAGADLQSLPAVVADLLS
jgi:hypothetical protein